MPVEDVDFHPLRQTTLTRAMPPATVPMLSRDVWNVNGSFRAGFHAGRSHDGGDHQEDSGLGSEDQSDALIRHILYKTELNKGIDVTSKLDQTDKLYHQSSSNILAGVGGQFGQEYSKIRTLSPRQSSLVIDARPVLRHQPPEATSKKLPICGKAGVEAVGTQQHKKVSNDASTTKSSSARPAQTKEHMPMQYVSALPGGDLNSVAESSHQEQISSPSLQELVRPRAPTPSFGPCDRTESELRNLLSQAMICLRTRLNELFEEVRTSQAYGERLCSTSEITGEGEDHLLRCFQQLGIAAQYITCAGGKTSSRVEGNQSTSGSSKRAKISSPSAATSYSQDQHDQNDGDDQDNARRKPPKNTPTTPADAVDGKTWLPCVARFGNPGKYGYCEVRRAFISQVARHLRQHNIFICPHCLQVLESSQIADDHRCIKCTNKSCRRAYPSSVPRSPSACAHINQPRQQWLAMLRKLYPCTPTPDGFQDVWLPADLMWPQASLTETGEEGAAPVENQALDADVRAEDWSFDDLMNWDASSHGTSEEQRAALFKDYPKTAVGSTQRQHGQGHATGEQSVLQADDGLKSPETGQEGDRNLSQRLETIEDEVVKLKHALAESQQREQASVARINATAGFCRMVIKALERRHDVTDEEVQDLKNLSKDVLRNNAVA